MEKIEWSDKYSVGVDILDQQHRQLIKMLNSLIEASTSEAKSKVVISTLAKMKKYARIHFKTEEHYLKTHNYVDFEDHQRKHREFEEKTESLIRATKLPVDQLPEAVLVYLRYWWLSHILVEDMKYKELLQD